MPLQTQVWLRFTPLSVWRCSESCVSSPWQECDPENQKVRQKLKAKEWDELIAKGKRFRVLQPVKIGCVWEGEESGSCSSSDLKLLQQFQASILDTRLGDEEQIEKSDKKTKDQQSKG